ncbi:hypothetical protein [Pseudomonas zhanjiangensis]|uniref:Uncharacterized protein n=1 Tax=Pseudomonas zhanjiangensis TaxID=3239015 RepID=A0ABV3YYY4_9PSED
MAPETFAAAAQAADRIFFDQIRGRFPQGRPNTSTEAKLAARMCDFYRFVVLVASLASIGQFTITHFLPAFDAIGRRSDRISERVSCARELVNPGGTALDTLRRLG